MTRTQLDNLAAQIARIMLGGFFMISAVSNFNNIFALSTKLNFTGAFTLIFLGALFKFTLGLGLALRYHTKYVSFGLAVYLAFVSVLFNGPQTWANDEINQLIFTRNFAIIAGLLFIYAHSRGVTLWQEEWIPKGQKELIQKELHKHDHPHPD